MDSRRLLTSFKNNKSSKELLIHDECTTLNCEFEENVVVEIVGSQLNQFTLVFKFNTYPESKIPRDRFI